MLFFSKTRIIVVLICLGLLTLLGVGFWTLGGRQGVEQPLSARATSIPVSPAQTLPVSAPVEAAGVSVPAVVTPTVTMSGPTLGLSPAPAQILINEISTTTLEVSDVSKLYGVELEVAYNPRYLAVVDAEPDTPGVQVVPGSVFGEANFFVVKNEVSGGVIRFVAARQAPAPPFNGSGPLLTIAWQGLTLGQTELNFHEIKLAGPDGRPLAVEAQASPLEVIPDLMTVQGQVVLPGRDHPGQVTLRVAGQTVHTGPDGRFIASIEGMTGKSGLTITMPGCLSVEIRGIASGDSDILDLGQITMVGGEMTGDDQIDLADLTFISDRYGSYDARADLNGDGLVDISDLTPTLANYGQRGPIQVNLEGISSPISPEVQAVPEDMPAPQRSPLAADYNGQIVQEWMQLLYDRVQADKLSPPAASRIYGYGGITLYEAVVPGMPDYRSLQWQLNGLSELPQPEEAAYHWPTVATSAMAEVTRALLASPESQAAIEQLREQQLNSPETSELSAEIVERSVAHGRRLGEALVAWIEADGYSEIHAQTFTSPVGPERWVPVGEQKPLEPYWGELRPFVLPSTDACEPPAPEPFSTDPASAFYREAHQVYEVSQGLTAQQKAIALFWADNPGETGTPPGHWVSIANQLIDQQQLNLGEAAHMHALLGIGLADAFISCWQEKYEIFLLRPATYIQQEIDPNWQTYIPTPPFPEYTSGHSVASGAAAEILTELFGPISFTDATHAGRGLGSATFNSFTAAAEEAAISRLYGGIHYPMAIENGLTQGQCVGRMVVERTLTD